jgi:ABC-type proline/glycine betaine transport system ATPase subunit/ABC-type glycerol-3-phosphate transport system permease component
MNPSLGLQGAMRGLGWESFTFDWITDPDMVLGALLIASLWQGVGFVMVLLLAGIRGIDDEIWKAARVDGIPTWRTYLFIVLPMMRGVFVTAVVIVGSGIVRVYDLVVAMTDGGPGIASEVPAKYVYNYMFGAGNIAQALAGSTMMLRDRAHPRHSVGLSRIRRTPGRQQMTDMALSGERPARPRPRDGVEPRGRKPKPVLHAPQGADLFGPGPVLPVLPVPALRDDHDVAETMPEIRFGNIFAPPVEFTGEAWVKAWTAACTGLTCEGLAPGFWNSVKITVPSTIISILIAAINGYALVNWRFRGSEVFFVILIFGSFIPYQVMLYPLVIITRELGIFGSLWAVVLVHTIFGMPILTLLFRNYFAALPQELFKRRGSTARASGGSSSRSCCRCRCPSSWSRSSCRSRASGTTSCSAWSLPAPRLPDDGPAQQHRELGAGQPRIQRQHGGDDPHRAGAADRLLRLRKMVRARHRRGRRERLIPMLVPNQSVSIRELRLDFGAVSVLKELNLDIAEGEFLVLLGSSGCGKSTLLNCIAGLLEPTDGQVWIKGRNVTWLEPNERGIGMVFQSYALYPQMTVRGNLSFGLRNARVPKADIEARVARAAKVLQIEPLLDRKPGQLSGGQRQRVAIGRALVRDVDVFLFDEPLSNLDAKLRADLRVEIKRLHQQLANTMIYVTHDQVEAMTLADRIAVMRGGRIMQLGTPARDLQPPAEPVRGRLHRLARR